MSVVRKLHGYANSGSALYTTGVPGRKHATMIHRAAWRFHLNSASSRSHPNGWKPIGRRFGSRLMAPSHSPTHPGRTTKAMMKKSAPVAAETMNGRHGRYDAKTAMCALGFVAETTLIA